MQPPTPEFVPSGYRDTDAPMEEAAVEHDVDRELVARALAGEYQIVRTLGRGGAGVVFLARDLQLHRMVAIKALRWELASSDAERERFRREARTSAQLSHPRIVPLHGYLETDDVACMVLRYVHGESLAARLARERRLHPEEVRRLLADLALTLEYAHRQGIVHRDLKPANILLEAQRDAAPVPMLMDFGVAMKRSWDPAPGELRRSFGTPHFMSPEQAAGEVDLDGRSDLFALGVLGWLMLAGDLPFGGGSPAAVAALRDGMEPRALARLAPLAPADLVRAIERCLRRDPAERFRHARDLHDALVVRRSRVARVGRAVGRGVRLVWHTVGRVFDAVRAPTPWPVGG